MNRRDLHEVAQERPSAWDHGFAPVPLFWHGYEDPKQAGKAPMHARWPARALRGDFAHASPSALLANTGIVAAPGTTCFTDRDLDVPAIAETVEAIERHHLGATITRRRANSSRSACAYRSDPDDPPGNREIKGPHGRIEILGERRQLASFGIHPSGVPILWPLGGPLDFPRHLLPVVSQRQMAAYLAEIAPILGANAPRHGDAVQHSGPTAEWQDTNLARLASAVMAIPVEGLSRSDWIRIGGSIYVATGGSESGLRLWDQWSAQSEHYDAEALQARWSGLGKGMTAGTVYFLARAQGWRPPQPEPPAAWLAAHPPHGLPEAV
jgi:hypothetical protein